MSQLKFILKIMKPTTKSANIYSLGPTYEQ